MKTFGLIGKSLSHSFSQQYFTERFMQEKLCGVEYQLFSLRNIEEVKELLKLPTLCGFNVTIPYKSEIISYLDELDPVAQKVGAVNCVIKQNNKWIGHNTDVIGVEETLFKVQSSKFKVQSSKFKDNAEHNLTFLRSYVLTFSSPALILGCGGAAKAVCYVLKQKAIPFQMVSRKKTEETITYNEITEELIHNSALIINTTPLGMFPNIEERPLIPYAALHKEHILIDLIYNPEETLFFFFVKQHDAFIINGLTMFKTQAEATFNLFLNS
jgi:shikimate dehydrogenase